MSKPARLVAPHFGKGQAFRACALALVLGACANGDLAHELAGRSFVSESVSGHELVKGSKVVVRFGDGALSVDAGCNTLDGPFTVEAGALHVRALRTTEMGCGGELAAQDRWLATFLRASPRITLREPRLRLSSGETGIELKEGGER